mmetsp:Transcript_11472/g.26216  ORF Transcript_11472/g.26216 Transcript_11472/m.26216 type:complete len:236 (+) Transcript_11472:1337-2044(+)
MQSPFAPQRPRSMRRIIREQVLSIRIRVICRHMSNGRFSQQGLLPDLLLQFIDSSLHFSLHSIMLLLEPLSHLSSLPLLALQHRLQLFHPHPVLPPPLLLRLLLLSLDPCSASRRGEKVPQHLCGFHLEVRGRLCALRLAGLLLVGGGGDTQQLPQSKAFDLLVFQLALHPQELRCHPFSYERRVILSCLQAQPEIFDFCSQVRILELTALARPALLACTVNLPLLLLSFLHPGV